MKKLVRDEKGAALVLALILLLIGGLISAALLGHMGAGLLAGEVYGRRTTELYAADAGVEGAIWKIQNKDGYLPCSPGSPDRNYTITDVNSKNVGLTIECVNTETDSITYKITSIAITDGDGSGGVAAIDSTTTVESYLSVSYMDLSSMLDNALVSDDTIDIQPGATVDGDIWLPDEEDLEEPPHWSHNGTVKDEDQMSITWPTAEQLSTYYLDDVDPSNPYPYNSIDITYTKNIGPCYIEGDFVVDNTGEPDTLVLDGTVYVNGDLEFEQPGASKDYTINLNGETIFVEGSITFPSAGTGDPKVSISGSGCIIAVGDIDFQPAIASGGDDFVFVFSITGTVWFHPSGEFTGCIAGNAHVELSSNNEIHWISPKGKGLNVPWGVGDDDDELPPVTGLSIKSWEIIQQ
jgi:hypothetical protein